MPFPCPSPDTLLDRARQALDETADTIRLAREAIAWARATVADIRAHRE
jgi:hypothetical protein